MFMGEINFDMYFVPLTLESAAPVNYPYATFTILPLFIVCMPLLLMNLLVTYIKFWRSTTFESH